MDARPRDYATPAVLLAAIPAEARRRRLASGLARFILAFAAYVVCVAGACVVPGPWAKGLAVLAGGFAIGGLYVVGHDAGHGSLVPGRRLNRWLARFAFFPAYAPLAGWYRAHVLLHHNHLRVKGRDMAWVPWSLDDYRRASLVRRAWYRFLRTLPGLSFYWTTGNWLPYLLFPPGEALGPRRRQFRFDRASVVAYALGLFVALNGLTRLAAGWPWAEPVGPLGVFLLGLTFPYLFWTYLIGLVDLVQHTHLSAVCFEDRADWDYFEANVRSTTRIVLPLGLGVLSHHILEHTAHHVDPRVPLYHLAEAQARLERAYPDDVPVETLGPGYVLRLLRTCRLYDYGRRQWLDYDGTPTSPAGRDNR